jgi:hypothetical protein
VQGFLLGRPAPIGDYAELTGHAAQMKKYARA